MPHNRIIKDATVIVAGTILAMVIAAVAANADQVVRQKAYGSFKACVADNGVALAELKGKGMTGEVLVNAENSYLAKIAINGASALLMCEGGRQQIVIVKN